jgi:hypothetical protein
MTGGKKEWDTKMELFLTFHIHLSVACQINIKPIGNLVFFAEALKILKMEKSEGGITSGTPIHLKNSHHTHIALGQ